MYKKASTGSQPFTNSLLEYTLIMGHTLSSLQKTTNFSCKKCVILSNLSLELSQHSTCVSITYISTRAPQSVATITYRLLYLICWRRSLALVKWQVCSSSWGRHRDGHHHTPTHANVRIAKRFVYSALPAKVCRRWLDDINIPFPDEPTATIVSKVFAEKSTQTQWPSPQCDFAHAKTFNWCWGPVEMNDWHIRGGMECFQNLQI